MERSASPSFTLGATGEAAATSKMADARIVMNAELNGMEGLLSEEYEYQRSPDCSELSKEPLDDCGPLSLTSMSGVPSVENVERTEQMVLSRRSYEWNRHHPNCRLKP